MLLVLLLREVSMADASFLHAKNEQCRIQGTRLYWQPRSPRLNSWSKTCHRHSKDILFYTRIIRTGKSTTASAEQRRSSKWLAAATLLSLFSCESSLDFPASWLMIPNCAEFFPVQSQHRVRPHQWYEFWNTCTCSVKNDQCHCRSILMVWFCHNLPI